MAIDLPLRVMVRDDGQDGSIVTWQDPAYVGDRFGLHDDQLKPLAAPRGLIAAAPTVKPSPTGHRRRRTPALAGPATAE